MTMVCLGEPEFTQTHPFIPIATSNGNAAANDDSTAHVGFSNLQTNKITVIDPPRISPSTALRDKINNKSNNMSTDSFN